MQADVAARLYNLSVEEHDICPNCKQFRDTVSHDCSAMLSALGQFRDMSISEPAPPAPELPRPQIPPGRPGKRAHGFMSLREPLVDDQGPNQDEPHCAGTSVTLGESSSFSYIPTPPQPDIPTYDSSSFVPPSQFPHFSSAGPSSYVPHTGLESSSYAPDPSFFNTPPSHVPYAYGSMTTLLTDPLAFTTEYAGHSFEFGGSSNVPQQDFMTPQQLIPSAQSPMWDLNSPPQIAQQTSQPEQDHDHDDDDDDDEQDEEEQPQLVLRRPQRMRRRPRCGTGSHYFNE